MKWFNSVSCRVVLLIAQMLVACGPKDESEVNAKDPCEGKFGPELNICRQGKSQEKLSGFGLLNQTVATLANRDAIGRPYAIKYAGNYKDCRGTQKKECGPDMVDTCLTVQGNRAMWAKCSPHDINQQFHFLDISNVKYSLHQDITHESVAFQISPRASAVSFQPHKAGENPNSNLKCLIPLPTHVAVAACKYAPFFVTLMSRHDDDDDLGRLTGGRYVSLMALMKDSTRIDEMIEKRLAEDAVKQKKEAADRTYAIKFFEKKAGEEDKSSESKEKEEVVDALREKLPFLDLGSFANRGGCVDFRLITKDGSKAVGKCSSGDIREEQNRTRESQVFLTSCRGNNLDIPADCSGLNPIKNLYDLIQGKKNGPVVKIQPEFNNKKVCLQVVGTKLNEIVTCDRNNQDNPAIQFRRELVERTDESLAKIRMRLRSLQQPNLCADIKDKKLTDCLTAPTYPVYQSAGDFTVNGESYWMAPCEIVTSHKKPNRYDCQDGRQALWNDLNEAAIYVSMIPILGTIVSSALDGYNCANAEGQMAEWGCMGLGLDIGLGVALDLLPYSWSVASITRSAVTDSVKSAGSRGIREVLDKALPKGSRGAFTASQSRNSKAGEISLVFQHGLVSRLYMQISNGQVKAKDVIGLMKDSMNIRCDRVICRAGTAVLPTTRAELRDFGRKLGLYYANQKNMSKVTRENWKNFATQLAQDTAFGAIIGIPIAESIKQGESGDKH